MYIYIDESGNFIDSSRRNVSFSCVGALIIPSMKFNKIEKKIKNLKNKWNFAGEEIKAKNLNSSQIEEICEMLRRYDCLFEVVAIDLNIHSKEEILTHKDIYIKNMENALKVNDDNEKLIKEMRDIPPQLYVQSVCQVSLVQKVLQHSRLYYAQRKPSELAVFNWIIDAKNNDLSSGERIWKKFIRPFMEYRSFEEDIFIYSLDENYNFSYEKQPSEEEYSNFFNSTKFEKIKELYPNLTPGHLTGMSQLDSISFINSKDSWGLQIADILVNSVRRSLHDNPFPKETLIKMGRLMILKNSQNGMSKNIEFVSLKDVENSANDSTSEIIKIFSQEARSLLK